MTGTERAKRGPGPASGDKAAGGTSSPQEHTRVPMLQVGAVDDAAEREADRVADQVIARLREPEHPAPGQDPSTAQAAGVVTARRAPTARRGGSRAPRVGRAGGPAGAQLSAGIEAMRGGGQALPEDVRRQMGAALGTDLSGVRVHTDTKAADAAEDLGAVAFTTGQDIFFGAGQYAPETAEGQRVLAHELAHTRQHAAGARRRVSRLWDMSGDVDFVQASRIRALKERLILFLDDDSRDTLVIKLDDQPVGLQDLSGKLQIALAGAKSIRYKRLGKKHRAQLHAMLTHGSGLLDRESWIKRGEFATRGSTQDPDELYAAGVKDWAGMLETPPPGYELEAMSLAKGQDAGRAAKRQEGSDQPSQLRELLGNGRHPQELGRMTAVDLFLGNADRVYAANLGNWFYDPAGAMTVIDNVDMNVRAFLRSTAGDNQYLQMLQGNKLSETAEECVSMLLGMAGKHDPGIRAWADGEVRKSLVEQFTEGMRAGKKEIVKTFTSTRWTLRASQHHARKKVLKAEAKSAAAQDTELGVDYYSILKARAAWLAKH